MSHITFIEQISHNTMSQIHKSVNWCKLLSGNTLPHACEHACLPSAKHNDACSNVVTHNITIGKCVLLKVMIAWVIAICNYIFGTAL